VPRVPGYVEQTRLTTTCVAFVALAAGLPAGAHAADPACKPSQDVAALDQYCEFLPSPEGDEQPVNSADQPTQRTPMSRALPRREVAMLRKSGPEGRALLLLPALAPVGLTPEQRRRIRITRERVLRSTTLDAPEVTPKTVISDVTAVGERTFASVFQWALLLCTVGFAGMAWLRFRTRLKF
jgi:hypothetical protein